VTEEKGLFWGDMRGRRKALRGRGLWFQGGPDRLSGEVQMVRKRKNAKAQWGDWASEGRNYGLTMT